MPQIKNKKPNKISYTLPTQKERDAYMSGQNWGIEKTLLALKKEVEIQMNEIVAGKDLLKSAKLSNWKEDGICIKGQLQALSQVIKLIEKKLK